MAKLTPLVNPDVSLFYKQRNVVNHLVCGLFLFSKSLNESLKITNVEEWLHLWTIDALGVCPGCTCIHLADPSIQCD